MRVVYRAVAAAALCALLTACDPLGLPATRQLENGAADMLNSSTSYEIKGEYSVAGARWSIALQLVKPDTRHLVATSNGQTVEAVIAGQNGYFRGQQFLAAHLKGNPFADSLVKAAGNAWWKDTTGLVPDLPDFTNATTFRATFLGTSATQRTDHLSVDGLDADELSGARADVYIATAPPYQLVRVHLKKGVVIDFSNFSTLPPIDTVVAVDTSHCGSTCVVTAKVKNLGGTGTAVAPSTVTFTMTDPATGKALGTCRGTVQPDVGYNSSTTASCTLSAAAVNGAVVTVVADNPGSG